MPPIIAPQNTQDLGDRMMREAKSSRQGSEEGFQGGKRTARTLPFSQKTFGLITKRFYTHGSIARVVSRADVPAFEAAEVHMGDAAGSYPAFGMLTKKFPSRWNKHRGLIADIPSLQLSLFQCLGHGSGLDCYALPALPPDIRHDIRMSRHC